MNQLMSLSLDILSLGNRSSIDKMCNNVYTIVYVLIDNTQCISKQRTVSSEANATYKKFLKKGDERETVSWHNNRHYIFVTGLLGTRPSMRKITQHSMMLKNLRIREAKQNTHRERERGTRNMSIHKMATVTISIITTNLYKRLQSHFIQ